MSERDIAKLLALVERHLGKSWVEVSDWLRDQNDLDAIESRLLAGDIQGVVREVESAARKFANDTKSQFIRAGEAESNYMNAKIEGKLISFDTTNDRAVRAARRNELELVAGLQNEQRTKIRNIVADGQRAGLNPRDMARDIRDSIGLTPYQEQVVRNYRRALEQGDYPNALGRELRDARSDRKLMRLMDEGGSLTPKQIDTMVERYRQNWIAFRAETVARTEAARNVHAGSREAFEQAIERGDIEADQLELEWHAGPNTPLARESHQALDGTRVKYGETFRTRNGNELRWPGDPMAPVSETANCRCTMSTVIA